MTSMLFFFFFSFPLWRGKCGRSTHHDYQNEIATKKDWKKFPHSFTHMHEIYWTYGLRATFGAKCWQQQRTCYIFSVIFFIFFFFPFHVKPQISAEGSLMITFSLFSLLAWRCFEHQNLIKTTKKVLIFFSPNQFASSACELTCTRRCVRC